VPINPRGGRKDASYDLRQPEIKIPRKVLKGGSHLCAPNYCRRYRGRAPPGSELYIACAEHDKLAPLPMVEELRTLFGRAGTAGEIELYPRVHHGFAFPQRWCYDRPAAEREQNLAGSAGQGTAAGRRCHPG
jgi:acetyl esterase/lipase